MKNHCVTCKRPYSEVEMQTRLEKWRTKYRENFKRRKALGLVTGYNKKYDHELIRRLRLQGTLCREIRAQVGCSYGTIARVCADLGKPKDLLPIGKSE